MGIKIGFPQCPVKQNKLYLYNSLAGVIIAWRNHDTLSTTNMRQDWTPACATYHEESPDINGQKCVSGVKHCSWQFFQI